MSEEIQKQKNTVATVGMWFSIIGLVLLITVFLARIWLPLLLIWLILWIIGLFSKPRGRAWIAVCIPVIVLIAFISIAGYVWNSIKAPTNELMEWIQPQLEQFENDENFDEDRFGDILQAELSNMSNNKSEDERKALFESSTGSNFLEKGAYMLSSMVKEWFENSLEKYNNELPEVENEEDVSLDENSEEVEEITIEDNNVIEDENSNEENADNLDEQNDIEQIINILE